MMMAAAAVLAVLISRLRATSCLSHQAGPPG